MSKPIGAGGGGTTIVNTYNNATVVQGYPYSIKDFSLRDIPGLVMALDAKQLQGIVAPGGTVSAGQLVDQSPLGTIFTPNNTVTYNEYVDSRTGFKVPAVTTVGHNGSGVSQLGGSIDTDLMCRPNAADSVWTMYGLYASNLGVLADGAINPLLSVIDDDSPNNSGSTRRGVTIQTYDGSATAGAAYLSATGNGVSSQESGVDRSETDLSMVYDLGLTTTTFFSIKQNIIFTELSDGVIALPVTPKPWVIGRRPTASPLYGSHKIAMLLLFRGTSPALSRPDVFWDAAIHDLFLARTRGEA
jgi:hypothetical protein